jgi:hypothetical protein
MHPNNKIELGEGVLYINYGTENERVLGTVKGGVLFTVDSEIEKQSKISKWLKKFKSWLR